MAYKILINTASICNIGMTRKTNQDRILVKTGDGKYGNFGLFLVADGMGGLSNGEKASEMIIEEFNAWWDNSLEKELKTMRSIKSDYFENTFDRIIDGVNARICGYSSETGEKMGSTLSLLFIFKDMYIIRHIGDSRIYCLDRGNGIRQVTTDHSWVARQVAESKMTKQEARVHPRRNILTQCIGVFENIHTESARGILNDTNVFLLCTDGFYNQLEEGVIARSIEEINMCSEYAIQARMEELCGMVLDSGAPDNVSAIAVYQSRGKRVGFFERVFRRNLINT